jgi:uncharacterized protein
VNACAFKKFGYVCTKDNKTNVCMLTTLPDTSFINPEYIIVKSSPIEGSGIFAGKSFEKDERVMIIAGEVISADECMRREDEENNVYIFWQDDNTFIDTANSGKIRYINHSCRANCYVIERDADSLWLMAAQNIAVGEEITIDYDFEEIYEMCQKLNPACAAADCEAKKQKATH